MSFRNDRAETGASLMATLVRRALFELPAQHTPRTFLVRTGYHLFVYGVLLLAAICLVLFVYYPFATGILLIVAVCLYALPSELTRRNSPPRRFARIQAFGISVFYILAASVLWKEFTEGGLAGFLERGLKIVPLLWFNR
jgi:hypothetical protein